MDIDPASGVRPVENDFRWQGVAHQPYKQDGTAPFKDISRQVLFHENRLGCELRYFEMDAGGHSTLERHEHAHAVMILRGSGECLLDDAVQVVKQFDLISIPSWTWHQFRATAGEPFGFLCMVNVQRDKPQLPSAEDLESIRQSPAAARFLDNEA